MLYLCLVIVLLPVLFIRPETSTCTRDEDCDEEYACSDKICTRCLKCDVLLRKGNDCVTDFSQCRECLEGYEEILLTDSSHVIKPCKPVRLKEKLNKEKCVDDNSCPPNSYCHNQICIMCFNCSLVNRVSTDRCAKELSDCGSCMSGYEEVAVTTGSNFKACERQSLSDVLRGRNYNMSAAGFLFALVTVLGVTLLAALYLELKKGKKGSILHKSRSSICPSAPPLHEIYVPQHIQAVAQQESHVAFTAEQYQQAKVSQQPTAPYYYKEDRVNANDCNSECVPNNTMNFSGPTGSDHSEIGVVVSGRIFGSNYVEPGADIIDFPHPSTSAINEVEANNITGNGSQLPPELLPQVINSNNSQATDVPVEETISTSSNCSQLELNPSA